MSRRFPVMFGLLFAFALLAQIAGAQSGAPKKLNATLRFTMPLP